MFTPMSALLVLVMFLCLISYSFILYTQTLDLSCKQAQSKLKKVVPYYLHPRPDSLGMHANDLQYN